MILTENNQNLLSSNQIFQDIPLEKVRWEFSSLKTGQFFDPAAGNEPRLGIVLSGEIAVYSVCPCGKQINISSHRKGDFFGISGFLSAKYAQTHLRCSKKTQMASISQSNFLTLSKEYPEVILRYGSLCNEKIVYLTKKIEFLSLPTCRSRLAHFLLSNSHDNVFTITYTKERMASMLGVSRATFFRELRRMQQEGLIDQEHKEITIKQPTALQEIVMQVA